jgi:YHS domain-containing protein
MAHMSMRVRFPAAQQPREHAMTVTDLVPLRRRSFAFAVAGAVAVLTAAPRLAHGFDETSPSAVNVDAQGLALRGYDPVSYQTGSKKPLRGSPQFSATHQGATYHFISAENRDVFRANPDRYVPAFGGFCAMGVAMGRKFDGDPLVYRVVDNRLYVKLHAGAQKKWLPDIPGHIRQAEANWPKIRGKTPRELAPR